MRKSKGNDDGQARGRTADGAVDPPIRLIMAMMAVGMIVGALSAPPKDGGADRESGLASFASSVAAVFDAPERD